MMHTLSLLCAVALAGVFATSGIAKLADREGTRQAVAGFGVGPTRVAAVASLLAPAELLVALALIVPATAVAGMILSLLLLSGFTRAIAMAMLNGRRPDCRCFGRIGGADISGRTVLRNVALAAIAVVGLATRGGAWTDLGAGQIAGGIAGGLALAAAVVGAEGLAGRAARLRRDRAEELAFDEQTTSEPGARETAPPFTLPDLDGAEESLHDLLGTDGRPTLVLFLSPGCGPCKVLRAAASRWVTAYGDRLQVAVIAQGSPATNRDDYSRVPGVTVLLDERGSVRAAFGLPGAPAAVLLDGDGRFLGPAASGEPLIRRLLETALRGNVQNGDEKPDLEQADAITSASVLRPRVTVTAAPTEDGVILVDEATGTSVSLDAIGSVVWSVLDGTSTLAQIIDDLADAFDARREVVERDTLGLARSLGRSGLLEGISPVPASQRARPALTPDHARG